MEGVVLSPTPDEQARASLLPLEVAIGPRRTFWEDTWRQFCRRTASLIGLRMLLLIVLLIVAGPLVYRASYSDVDFKRALLPLSLAHPLGTNDLGQDMLARVLNGGRVSIIVGVFSMLVGISVGTIIGTLSGFFGGAVDSLLMRVTDLFLSLPVLPVLLAVIYLFRDSIKRVLGPEAGIFVLIILVIGLLNWMSVARLVRASVLSIREMEFVSAARSMGASPWRLLGRHVLPNALGPVIVAATLSVGTAILTESTLSFLGLGFPPDTPSWGRMLFDAQGFLDISPLMAIVPGTAIFLTILCTNAVGDGLRDALDPRLGER